LEKALVLFLPLKTTKILEHRMTTKVSNAYALRGINLYLLSGAWSYLRGVIGCLHAFFMCVREF